MHTQTTESVFAQISLELAFDASRKVSKSHDEVTAEVMSEIAADYFPGVTFVAVEG